MLSNGNYDTLKTFPTDGYMEIGENNYPEDRIRYLLETGFLERMAVRQENSSDEGLIIRVCNFIYGYRLTSKGTDALQEYEQSAEREAKEKRRSRKDKWSQRAWELFIAFIGGAITLLVEHFGEVLTFFRESFKH